MTRQDAAIKANELLTHSCAHPSDICVSGPCPCKSGIAAALIAAYNAGLEGAAGDADCLDKRNPDVGAARLAAAIRARKIT